MKCFVSNHLEILADLLKNELFGGEDPPFAKKWVVVPNERVKQDLVLKWAQDPHLLVATGMKMITWLEALSRLFPGFLCRTELALKIEAAIERLDPASIAPLLAYLNAGGVARKLSLCDQMSALFLHYLDQPEEKLVPWIHESGWQQVLWKEVFKNEMPWKTHHLLEGKVYLFHPFHLSFYQFEIFKKMNATCFLFSPSEMYWGDFRTFRQQRALLKKAGKSEEQLIFYFENQHPLLSNWGLKGRHLLSLFEDEEFMDAYQEPAGSSLLQTVQQEMLTLASLEKSPDDSIQVHSAPSKLREVEMVWEIIQQLPFEPKEILVLVPEMGNYAALIELVFRQKGGAYDFAVYCLEAHTKNPLMQGLEALLELPKYRFSKEVVERLLFCPAFLKKFDLTLEEVQRLEKWMSRLHARWDLKGDHAGSWNAVLKRLVEALIVTAKNDRMSLEFSEADLISRWILIVQLFEKELTDLEKLRTLKEWSFKIISLLETFFDFDPDNELIYELEKWRHIEIDEKFSFLSLDRVLKNIYRQKSGAIQASHLQAVRFTGLEKGALIPAKAIILMGMEEGAFPRQERPSSLQELKGAPQMEEDKYLFLEALCCARERFILTYTRIHPEDGKSQKASSVVEELMHHVSISVIDHPPVPLKEAHFLEKKAPHLPTPAASFDTRMLRQLARHPLQFFFEERLGIDFEWKENESEFLLSPLDMMRLRKESLLIPIQKLLEEMQAEGRLPVGSFGEAAEQKIRSDIESYHEALEKLGVKPEEIHSIELSASFPIKGKLDNLCPQGLLFHGEDTLADRLKVWPLYLITKILFPKAQLLLTKKGKPSELEIADPAQALQRYLSYAQRALSTPSPLHPKWARTIFKEGKIPSLTEEDDILEWAQARNLIPTRVPWLEEWKNDLQEVFHELL